MLRYTLPFLKIDNFYDGGVKLIDECENDPHPGPKSNALAADKIYKILNDKTK
jgi:hypothetical protein